MTDDDSPDEVEPAWDFGTEAPRDFRNAAWQLLGQTRKRDVFLSVREVADEGGALEGAAIGRRATEKPHFDDDANPDLSDNGDLEALCRLLVGYPVPKLARPERWFFVPFEPMCEYLVNPFHEPSSPAVRAAIRYIRANDPEMALDGSDAEPDDDDPVPIDTFATEAHTFVRLAEHLDCTAPKLTFSEFRPDDFGGQVGQGLVIEGALVTETMSLREGSTDSDLKGALHELFAEYAEHVARGKKVFQVGLYQDDETNKRTARRAAIADNAGFATFEPDLERGHLTFRWETDPVLLL